MLDTKIINIGYDLRELYQEIHVYIVVVELHLPTATRNSLLPLPSYLASRPQTTESSAGCYREH